MIRLLYFIPTYILFTLFRTLMILLGWTVIPPMALLNKYTSKEEFSRINGRKIINWKSSLMYVWSNDEDGIYAGEEFLGYPTWFRIIYWSAFRNPANNLRFIPYISCSINTDKVKYIGTRPIRQCNKITDISVPPLLRYDDDRFTFASLTWQGIYSNFRWQFKMFGKVWRFWIGWKIYPHDSLGLRETDYRKYGAGFATQFKRVYSR